MFTRLGVREGCDGGRNELNSIIHQQRLKPYITPPVQLPTRPQETIEIDPESDEDDNEHEH